MFTLVVKAALDFLNNEPQDANQEEHTKWFNAQWQKNPKSIQVFDTKEEAIEAGIAQDYLNWWIVYDKEGNKVDGGY